jgi:hypothetical protein
MPSIFYENFNLRSNAGMESIIDCNTHLFAAFTGIRMAKQTQNIFLSMKEANGRMERIG